jgi:non-homologous end joining protein Ku
LIAAKAKGKEVQAVPEPKVGKVVDIMDALRKSLETRKKADRERTVSAKKTPSRRRSSAA